MNYTPLQGTHDAPRIVCARVLCTTDKTWVEKQWYKEWLELSHKKIILFLRFLACTSGGLDDRVESNVTSRNHVTGKVQNTIKADIYVCSYVLCVDNKLMDKAFLSTQHIRFINYYTFFVSINCYFMEDAYTRFIDCIIFILIRIVFS